MQRYPDKFSKYQHDVQNLKSRAKDILNIIPNTAAYSKQKLQGMKNNLHNTVDELAAAKAKARRYGRSRSPEVWSRKYNDEQFNSPRIDVSRKSPTERKHTIYRVSSPMRVSERGMANRVHKGRKRDDNDPQARVSFASAGVTHTEQYGLP